MANKGDTILNVARWAWGKGPVRSAPDAPRGVGGGKRVASEGTTARTDANAAKTDFSALGNKEEPNIEAPQPTNSEGVEATFDDILPPGQKPQPSAKSEPTAEEAPQPTNSEGVEATFDDILPPGQKPQPSAKSEPTAEEAPKAAEKPADAAAGPKAEEPKAAADNAAKTKVDPAAAAQGNARKIKDFLRGDTIDGDPRAVIEELRTNLTDSGGLVKGPATRKQKPEQTLQKIIDGDNVTAGDFQKLDDHIIDEKMTRDKALRKEALAAQGGPRRGLLSRIVGIPAAAWRNKFSFALLGGAAWVAGPVLLDSAYDVMYEFNETLPWPIKRDLAPRDGSVSQEVIDNAPVVNVDTSHLNLPSTVSEFLPLQRQFAKSLVNSDVKFDTRDRALCAVNKTSKAFASAVGNLDSINIPPSLDDPWVQSAVSKSERLSGLVNDWGKYGAEVRIAFIAAGRMEHALQGCSTGQEKISSWMGEDSKKEIKKLAIEQISAILK